MRILGLSAFGGESAAALLVDGVPVAAAAESRFSGLRRDPAFPRRAVRFCLREGGLDAAGLDYVAFHEKPLRAFERVLVSQLRGFPGSARSFSRSMFLWLGDRLWIKDRLTTERGVPAEKVLFVEHHQAHAAAAFLPSPFERAAILVAAGAGEWASTSLHRGQGAALEPLGEVRFPHSLGLFLAAMAEHLGFPPGGGEERLLELAAYGQPTRVEPLRRLLRVAADGSYEIDTSPFRFGFDAERLCGPGLAEVVGPPRAAGATLRLSGADRADADLAASVRLVLEEALLALLARLKQAAPEEALCLAGDVLLHPSLLHRLLRDGPFARVFVQPAAGDSGPALGAALAAHAQLGGARSWRQEHCFLGEDVLSDAGAEARALPGDDAIVDALLEALLRGGQVGWVRGRFEWGPRALGHRSLLADPRRAAIGAEVNASVKRRESFRPFACAVTAEAAPALFELPRGGEWPLRFQQTLAPATDAARAAAPALVHADGSARPQVVHAGADPLLHRLLTRFGEATGLPLLLHSGLGLRGAPPVRGEAEARALFARSALPALVVEDRLYARS